MYYHLKPGNPLKVEGVSYIIPGTWWVCTKGYWTASYCCYYICFQQGCVLLHLDTQRGSDDSAIKHVTLSIEALWTLLFTQHTDLVQSLRTLTQIFLGWCHVFNFSLKVCDIICTEKAEWNLENLNFIFDNRKVKVSNMDGEKLWNCFKFQTLYKSALVG